MSTDNSSSAPSDSSASTPGQPRFASVDGNHVHYRILGQGNPTVVLIHGWAGNLGVWQEQISLLAGQAKLILVDLPGHGQSDKPQAAYTLDFFAKAVLTVLRDAQAGPAFFMGHSMGAAVICRLYAQAPEKIAGIISVDGLLRRPSGAPEEVRALVGPFGTPRYAHHATKLIDSFFPVPGNESLRERLKLEMLKTPQHVMLGSMLGMFGPDQPDWILGKVNIPIAAINAPGLWWADGFEHYVRSLSPQSDYVLMEDVGHFLMLEKPAQFNAALSSVLQKFGLIQ